jgi:hypothetical protein
MNENALYTLPPPYTAFAPIEDGTHRLAPARGVLLALRPFHGATADAVIASLTPLQQACLRCTFVLWLDLVGIIRSPGLIAAASRRGVRAFIMRAVPDPDLIRMELTSWLTFPENLATWMQRRGFRVTDSVAALIKATVKHAIDCRSVSELAARTGGNAGRWRADLRRANVGSVQQFHQIVRLLAIALHIQRFPGRSLSAVAVAYNYYDAAALRHRTADVFGCAPSDIRTHLGWEWLADAACRRGGLASASIDKGSNF